LSNKKEIYCLLDAWFWGTGMRFGEVLTKRGDVKRLETGLDPLSG